MHVKSYIIRSDLDTPPVKVFIDIYRFREYIARASDIMILIVNEIHHSLTS